MRRLSVLAAIPVAVMLVAGTVAAQDDEGTPVAARLISPEECKVQARSTDEIFADLGLNGQPPASPPAGGPSLTAPLGQPADLDTKNAIDASVRELLGCLNGGDLPRAAALMTDHGIQRFWGVGPREETAANQLQQLFTNPPQPRDEAAYVRLLAITDTSTLQDGRVAAFVVLNEPLLPPRGPETLLFLFAKQGDRWLLDDFLDFTVAPPAPEGTPAATPPA